MNRYRPEYTVTIGQNVIDPGSEALILLETERLLNEGADAARILLGRINNLSVARGDEVTVDLGWDGETVAVFTGTLEQVEEELGRVRLEAVGIQQPLLQLRQDKTFVSQKAGDIVQSLAGDAGVDVEKAEAGLEFPMYAADSGRNCYEHCLRLARWCGFDVSATTDGKLLFAAFANQGPAFSYEYGINILDASFSESTPLEGVQFAPESPSSQSGADTASWIIKDSSSQIGQGGSGGAIFSEPALRTKAAAESAAKAIITFSKRDARRISIRVAGEPELDLSDVVELGNLPREDWNGEYQVMVIRHHLSRQQGFITDIGMGGIPE